jgi:exopolysaccharide biosynthesis polyprenyl glycosylphosphotransferase
MVTGPNRPLRVLVLVLDAVIVLVAMVLAAGLHAALRDHVGMLKYIPRFDEYALVVYLSIPIWLALIALFGLHQTFERVWTRGALLFDLLKLHVAGFIALSVAVVFTQSVINRSVIALFLSSSFVLSYAVRAALGLWQQYQHRSGQTQTRLLVIGEDSADLQQLIRATSAEGRPPFIVGHLGAADVAGVRRLGGLDDIERILHEEAVDRVLFLPPYDRADAAAAALAACETVGVSAELAINVVGPARARPRVIELYGHPFLSLDPAPKPREQIAIKHAFDWLVSAIALIVLSPLFVAVSIAILVTMGRPVFFTQTRAGLYGRQFRMIKFRTMIADAEAKQASLAAQNEMTGPVFKITRDPRVTRLGAFLRKSSIDELPQLLNVFLGQMSLVGPRPLPIKEQQGIRGWHRRRLSMKPGITGIWQVSGRSDIDFEQWMTLDQKYVDEWSLGLDLTILAKTVPVVFLRRGAR